MQELSGYIRESIERSRLLYIGVTLDEYSKNVLEEFFEKHNPWKNANIKKICHHMTIAFKTNVNDELYKWSLTNTNKNYKLKVLGYGWSNKAFAVFVDTIVPSANKVKHITCAVNLDKRGKPVDSNGINNWKTIDEPIFLSGNVEFHYTKNEAQN
jgi:hypothetical protein